MGLGVYGAPCERFRLNPADCKTIIHFETQLLNLPTRTQSPIIEFPNPIIDFETQLLRLPIRGPPIIEFQTQLVTRKLNY